MKKKSIISLIILCVSIFAFAIFSACTPNTTAPTVKEIKFKNETVKTIYMLDEQIDYSTIKLIVEYSDQTTKEFVLTDTDNGVEYTPIDTSTAGQKVLSATFNGKEVVMNVEVVRTILGIKFQESSLTFDYKGEFNKEDVKLQIIYDDETFIKTIALSDAGVSIKQEISLTDKALIGQTQVLEVEYNGKTAHVNVVVNKVLIDVKFKEGVKTEYSVNDSIDYSQIFIVATYNDDSTVELPITDNSINYDPIDTSVDGSYKFNVEFMGKTSDELNFVIKPLIAPEQFTYPAAYQQYLTKSQDNTYKVKSDVKNNPYLVGSINKFSFVPRAAYFDLTLVDTVQIANPITVFKLYEKVEGQYVLVDSPDKYVTVENNMYKFNSTANDKFFKMEVSLDKNRYNLSFWGWEKPVISIEFKVVDAYNAYDTYGLSVLDNLNVKNWAEIKDRTLKYDDKKLSEYTDVKLIVLHNDIVINADELPENYFWSDDMYGYNTAYQKASAADALTQGTSQFAKRLKGSLRNGLGGDTYNHCDNQGISKELNTLDINGNPRKDYAETWKCQNVQKGIFNTNQTSLSGNYMTISTSDSESRHLTSILGHDYKEGDADSMINQVSHWSLFKFYKTDDLVDNKTTVNLSFDNIMLLGNMPKINQDGQEAGLMAMNTFIDKMTINNVITTQFYTHIVCDGGDRGTCELEFNDSIMTDAYSNMFYLWRSNVSVNRSIMKNAGGPLFILCDADRTTETVPGPVLKIDNESDLESYAAGTEAWYKMYDAQILLNMLKADVSQMLSPLGKTFVHTVNSVDQINIIAAMIPTPTSIFSSHDTPINIKGKLIRNETELFDMESQYITNVTKPSNTIGFLSGNQFAFYAGANGVLELDLTTGSPKAPTDFAANSTDMLTLVMSAQLASPGLANAPYFGVVLGDYLTQKQNITI